MLTIQELAYAVALAYDKISEAQYQSLESRTLLDQRLVSSFGVTSVILKDKLESFITFLKSETQIHRPGIAISIYLDCRRPGCSEDMGYCSVCGSDLVLDPDGVVCPKGHVPAWKKG